MTQKIAKVPMPVRENLPEINEDDLNSNYSRVVFSEDGQNYTCSFEQESLLPLPALFSEGSSVNNLSENSPADIFNEVQNPENSVTEEPGSIALTSAFILKSGFVYRLEGLLTSRNTSQDYSGVEFTWRVDGNFEGNTGFSGSYDQSGEGNQYGEQGSVPAVCFIENGSGVDMEAYLFVTNLDGNTNSTNGFSKAEFTILRKI